MSWIYHSRDRKQCYYRQSCTVCYTHLFFTILKLSWRLNRK